jgi:hypothetical protein
MRLQILVYADPAMFTNAMKLRVEYVVLNNANEATLTLWPIGRSVDFQLSLPAHSPMQSIMGGISTGSGVMFKAKKKILGMALTNALITLHVMERRKERRKERHA